LGTSSLQEAKDYFNALSGHRITLRWDGEGDGRLIDMFFSKDKAKERKQWIEDCFEVSSRRSHTAN
jgi:DNA topoisomerase-2